DFRQALKLGHRRNMGAIVVVSRSQTEQLPSLNTVHSRGKALAPPIQLRDLRLALESLNSHTPAVGR
ncbi:MAG: hypothetical protein KDA90_15665, partial [Planctomycetaceae bacterium]|nr:hypothetical protein [Planctomycetaceae bacterium]